MEEVEITDLELLREARAIQIKILKNLGRESEIAQLEPIEPDVER